LENLRFLKSKEVKQIFKIIEDRWGFKDRLEHVFLMDKEGDVFIINRDMEKVDFESLRINNIGLYLCEYRNDDVRLGIEGSQIIGPKADKNILELSDEQVKEYMKGNELEIDKENSGFLILKNSNNYFGCSKIKNRRLLNFFPKARRINQ